MQPVTSHCCDACEPTAESVWAPEFDRALEEPIAGAIEVPARTQLIITEGNYLLLAARPWNTVRENMDEVWFVELATTQRHSRLIARHESYGRSTAEASERSLGTDERNARLINATRADADALLLETAANATAANEPPSSPTHADPTQSPAAPTPTEPSQRPGSSSVEFDEFG